MTDASDGVTMIGLHQLSRDALGSVPEISGSLSRHGVARRAPNIVDFPSEAARPPGEVAPVVFGHDAATGRNVVAFAAAAGKSQVRSRKA